MTFDPFDPRTWADYDADAEAIAPFAGQVPEDVVKSIAEDPRGAIIIECVKTHCVAVTEDTAAALLEGLVGGMGGQRPTEEHFAELIQWVEHGRVIVALADAIIAGELDVAPGRDNSEDQWLFTIAHKYAVLIISGLGHLGSMGGIGGYLPPRAAD